MISTEYRLISDQREEILCLACKNLGTDLMKIEPALFLLFFKFGEGSTLYDHVNEVIDSNFTKGAMSFACTGDSFCDWNKPAVVAVDLEILSGGIFVFFRLLLSGNNVGVELHHISFPDCERTPAENTAALRDMINTISL